MAEWTLDMINLKVWWGDFPGLANVIRGAGGSGWGTHVNPWLIHVNVWQKSLQYCKVISLQLIKINEKKKKCAYEKSGKSRVRGQLKDAAVLALKMEGGRGHQPRNAGCLQNLGKARQ